eukprot:3716664-Pyramimonas_sp.AAC.1
MGVAQAKTPHRPREAGPPRSQLPSAGPCALPVECRPPLGDHPYYETDRHATLISPKSSNGRYRRWLRGSRLLYITVNEVQ